eukprot:5181866-Prymnesium_polylepis.1
MPTCSHASPDWIGSPLASQLAMSSALLRRHVASRSTSRSRWCTPSSSSARVRRASTMSPSASCAFPAASESSETSSCSSAEAAGSPASATCVEWV